MGLAISSVVGAIFIGSALVRESYRFGGNLDFGQLAALRYLLNYVTVTVTCREVHFAVHTSGVFTQGLFDYAHRLDELPPVYRAEETEAADAVAHRDLISRLLLGLRLHQIVDRQSRCSIHVRGIARAGP